MGIVRDAAIQWMRQRQWAFDWTLPIVGETYDGYLNDIDGGHIHARHVFEALDGAGAGRIAEGNVGGGAGMITYWYKGGTGTASRRLAAADGGYTVGVLVQSNYGQRRHLRVGGIPVGRYVAEDLPRFMDPTLLSPDLRVRCAPWVTPGDGSIIVVVATDAPVLPHQLRRIAKRPALAIGRLGGVGAAASGDIFIAFSTANGSVREEPGTMAAASAIELHPNLGLTALFEATIDATEEAILNALVAAEDAEGANRLYVPRLPHARIQQALRSHNLLTDR
ncbi:MAG TPA: P1 family peptidase [Steroidobacteraceae bacterium]|nr:P1 family peptidase [Steroidobacteraceae bacterium]